MAYNFLRALRLFVDLEGFSSHRIDDTQRRMKSQGDINAVSNGHQSSLKLTWCPAPVDDMGKPRTEGTFPEQNSVVRIAGYKMPFGRSPDGCNGPLVGDVEYSSAS